MRPGIVHRLDKETSGLIIVAKNDRTHQALSEMFSSRSLRKTYLALVHGEVKQDSGTINAPVSRDLVRRTPDDYAAYRYGQDGDLALQGLAAAEYALWAFHSGFGAD